MNMFPYDFAHDIAEEFVQELSGFCDRIEIVGSLRRLKPGVNDIDILVIPKYIQLCDETLFGEPVFDNLVDKRLAEMCFSGELSLDANGQKIKRFIKSVDGDDVPIDLYVATPQTWWTMLVIRTGSKRHNIALARRAQELHMQLKADGSGIISPDGKLIPIQSEEHLFQLLGYIYRSPEERE